MTPEAERVHSEFVAAYEPYVAGRLSERGIEATPSIDASIVAGGERLDVELRSMLMLPAAQQRRSPLEIFREALRFPTEALVGRGVPPVPRDGRSESMLPDDPYDLVPASSQLLGRDAWEAHLAWGAAKASELGGSAQRAPRRPTAVLVTRDLMDRSKIEPAAEAAGYELVVVDGPPSMEGSDRPAVALVDLEHPSADDAVRALSSAGVRTVAYGPHVDDIAITRARTLGAADALARGRFFAHLSRYFPAPI